MSQIDVTASFLSDYGKLIIFYHRVLQLRLILSQIAAIDADLSPIAATDANLSQIPVIDAY